MNNPFYFATISWVLAQSVWVISGIYGGYIAIKIGVKSGGINDIRLAFQK
jgi:protein-S-isoprenylcysteine O-methyltransferase Ste14